MASSGNTWQKKLIAKQKRFAVRQNGNTFKGVLARSSSTHHEKVIAFKAQQLLLAHDEDRGKVPVVIAAIFDGTGLPDEVAKVSKPKDREFNAPMRVGFVVRGFGKKIAAREVRGFAMPTKS